MTRGLQTLCSLALLLSPRMDTADLISKGILLQIPSSHGWLKLLVHSLNQYVFIAFQMLLLFFSLSIGWVGTLQRVHIWAPASSPLRYTQQCSTIQRIQREVLGSGCQVFLFRSRARNFAEARQDRFHPGRCTELGQTRRSWRGHTQGDLVGTH